MRLADVLKLDNNIDNLNQIHEFLNQIISQYDYEAAVLHYVKIAYNNELYDLVISEGEQMLEKFKNQSPTNYREKIYGVLINAALKNALFETAHEYIEKRKALLPILDQYLALLDEISYKKAMNEEYLYIVKKLIVEPIPHDVKTELYEELLNDYLRNEDFSNALDIIDKLKDHTLSYKYDAQKAFILFSQKKFNELATVCEKTLEIDPGNIVIIGYLISAYIHIGKHQRASSLEAEHELLIDQFEDNAFKAFIYEEIMALYKMMQNNHSFNIYDRKLKRLRKAKVEDTPKEAEIVVNTVEIKEIQTTKLVSNAKYLEHFEWVRTWLIYSHNIDIKLPLREYLRDLFIKIEQKIVFKDIILYVDGVYESNLFNYKKERLYDKNIINQFVLDTIVDNVLKQQDHLFGTPVSLDLNKDILTQKAYLDDVKFLYGLYLADNTVLVFYFEEEIQDSSIYFELLSGIASIVMTRLIDLDSTKRIRLDSGLLNDIINNQVMPIRLLTETKSSYNLSATKLLNVEEKLHLELFLREMNLEDVDSYSKDIKRLFNYPNETKIVKYQFQDKMILEYMFARKHESDVTIISFFINQTAEQTKENILVEKASVDLETGLKNKLQLLSNTKQYLEEKVSFVLVELNQDTRNIYGNDKTNKHFIEFARATNKHFAEYDVYRYDFNQVIIVLPFNDIRAVNNEMIDYFQVVSHLKSTILKYEHFIISAGIVRYPINTTDKNIDTVLKYLDVALMRSKNDKHNNFVNFSYSDYEKDIFEQSVIDYLNTAIENQQLAINLRQIIDLEKNVIWNYESQIFLPNINIDNKYLTIIAKKRKKIVELEYFHINAVASFLNKLENETKHLVKITIPVSKETFLTHDFNSYLISTLKKYNIPSEFIRILCDLEINEQKIAVKVQELLKYGISLDSTNIETVLYNDFNALHLNYTSFNSKWKSYFKHMNQYLKEHNIALVLKEVNSKEDRDVIRNLGIRYVEGDVYKMINPDSLINKIKESVK